MGSTRRYTSESMAGSVDQPFNWGMKAKVCSGLLLLALVALVRADAVSELVARDCPSPDREWQAKDYQTLQELLVRGTLRLPRLMSEFGRPILHRLVDTEHLSFHRNRNLRLETRFPDMMNLLDSSKGIMIRYVRTANAGEKVERGRADLRVFQLAVGGTGIELTEEFQPSSKMKIARPE